MPIEVGDLKLYDLEDISKITGLHVRTLRSAIRAGKMKARKVGKKFLVKEEDLQAFLAG